MDLLGGRFIARYQVRVVFTLSASAVLLHQIVSLRPILFMLIFCPLTLRMSGFSHGFRLSFTVPLESMSCRMPSAIRCLNSAE